VALAKAEAEMLELPMNTVLARNVAWLGEAAGLSLTDQALLHFVALAFHHPGLENALEQIGGLSMGALHALFVRVLGLPMREVVRSLDATGPLARTGLVQVDSAGNYVFRGKVEALSGLVDRLTIPHLEPLGLFRGAFELGRKGALSLGHYPHLTKDMDILIPYLQAALEQKRKGVNILIHGTPGTGKTELVRALARHLGARLCEVSAERPNGEPVEGEDRFRGYRLAQAVLGKMPGQLVFFDEIEDVFRPKNDGPRAFQSNTSGLKAWVNRMLEENPAPAFWVTNHLHVLDDAFIRRCDFVLRLDNPPRSVRRRMLEDHLGMLSVSDLRKDRLAEHEGLSPALISKAARVIESVHSSHPQVDAGEAVDHLLGNALEALGHARSAKQAVEVVTTYRPELVNTDCDLAAVSEGLRQGSGGRLCFYGPPGTGKTAYGRHLARILDRPLLVKRASDILSMWVGGTEKNLAAMFEEARLEKAVLLLDEADGFLQDRNGAQRNFEVTAVNEMLTQMEAFEGVFIASTNLMDRLDTAALRRFDLKVHFDYLRPEQAWILFQDVAGRLGLPADPTLIPALGDLGTLTPGDFATVVRQARMNPPKDADDLLTRLDAECRAKPEGRRRPIGFTRRVS
jgi:SpoVK/Ycf46/Vps4 family AAA+-type ATPase